MSPRIKALTISVFCMLLLLSCVSRPSPTTTLTPEQSAQGPSPTLRQERDKSSPPPAPTYEPSQTPIVVSTKHPPTPTLTLTPTPTPTLTPTPTPDEVLDLSSITPQVFSPTPEGRLFTLPPFSPSMAWDGDTLYWARGEPSTPLYRYNVRTSKKEEVFLRSHFPTGTLGGSRLIIRNRWLVFLDIEDYQKVFRWEIRAIHLGTGTERVLLKITDPRFASWPGPIYDFDGTQVGITYTTWDEKQTCSLSHLVVIDVQTGEKETIEEHCADWGPFLWGPVVLYRDLLVAEQDLPESEEYKNYLVFFRRTEKGWQEVEQIKDGYASMPVLEWPWLVWKNTQRYAYGDRVTAYNLEDGTKWHFATPRTSSSDPWLCGNWLTWNYTIRSSANRAGIGGEIYLYRLPYGPLVKMTSLTSPFTDPAPVCNAKWIAWARGWGRSPYRIEWVPRTSLEAVLMGEGGEEPITEHSRRVRGIVGCGGGLGCE